MSAYICDQNLINKIAEYLTSNRTDVGLEMEGHVFTSDDFNPLAQALWDMNVSAVSYRYPKDTLETLPGPIDKNFIPRRSVFLAPQEAYEGFREYLYQCSEGETVNCNLFKSIESAHNEIAHNIARMYIDRFNRAA